MTCDVAIIKKAFPAAPSHWIWKIFFPKDICAQENTGGIVAGTTVAFCNRLHPETFFSPLTSKKLHIESLESIFYWFVALLCCFNFRIMHLFLLGLQISAPGNMIIQSVIPFSNPTGLNKKNFVQPDQKCWQHSWSDFFARMLPSLMVRDQTKKKLHLWEYPCRYLTRLQSNKFDIQSNPVFWNRLIIFGALPWPNQWFNQ